MNHSAICYLFCTLWNSCYNFTSNITDSDHHILQQTKISEGVISQTTQRTAGLLIILCKPQQHKIEAASLCVTTDTSI